MPSIIPAIPAADTIVLGIGAAAVLLIVLASVFTRFLFGGTDL